MTQPHIEATNVLKPVQASAQTSAVTHLFALACPICGARQPPSKSTVCHSQHGLPLAARPRIDPSRRRVERTNDGTEVIWNSFGTCPVDQEEPMTSQAAGLYTL